jgi:Flp pilus assembly protein TadD
LLSRIWRAIIARKRCHMSVRLAGGLLLILLSALPSIRAEDPHSLLGKGFEALNQARYEAAIESFQRALELDPTLAIARYDLGVCYFSEGQFEDARRSFEESRRLNPAHPFTAYYLARLDLLEDRVDEAIREFQALAKDKPIADEFYYLGSAWFRKGDFAAAAKSLERAAAVQPGDYRIPFLLARTYAKMRRNTAAEQQYALSTKLRDADRQSAEDLLTCDTALSSLPPAAAIERCRAALYGADPGKLVSLGVALGQHGRYEDALDPLAKAARLDPENYEPHFNLGLTYFHLKRYADAQQPLETAVSLRPEAFEALAVSGSILFALGDDGAALPRLRHAHELRPGEPKMKQLLIEELKISARHATTEKDYDQAIALWEEALRLEPGSAELRGAIAEAEHEKALARDTGRRP